MQRVETTSLAALRSRYWSPYVCRTSSPPPSMTGCIQRAIVPVKAKTSEERSAVCSRHQAAVASLLARFASLASLPMCASSIQTALKCRSAKWPALHARHAFVTVQSTTHASAKSRACCGLLAGSKPAGMT